MRNILLTTALLCAQPVFAANVDFDMTFDRDFFQDVFYFDTGPALLSDGAPAGAVGAFSGLNAGDTVSVSIELEEQGSFFSVNACSIGTVSCGGDLVQYTPGTSLLISDFYKTVNVNFETGEALFFDETGGDFDEGFYRAYGAEFTVSSVPVPMSAGLLLSGFVLLGLKRRRNS